MRSIRFHATASLLLVILGCGNPPSPGVGGPARPPAAGSTTSTPAGVTPSRPAAPPTAAARDQVDPAPGFTLAIVQPPPLFAGSKQTLWAGTPGKGLLWESSNPAVAAVDSTGVVHAINPGTASITARLVLPDGSEQTASTAVTVRSNPLGDTSRAHRGHRR
jgi:hypothetical protein